MVNNLLILLFSFTASLAFSVTFGIHGKDKLLYAGLGGFLVRLVNITLSSFTQNYFVITLISALAASLYGENRNKENAEAILTSILIMHNNYIRRVSHVEPGMAAHAYFKDLKDKFSKEVNEIVDQLNNLA